MEEIWKDVKGYEGLYQISNLGRVRGLDRMCFDSLRKRHIKLKSKILKTKTREKDYSRVYLCKKSVTRCFFVHRLVAIHFIPNIRNKPEVNHKNGIKTDNRVGNLEWNTRSENVRHSIKNGLLVARKGERASSAKITEKDVLEIREMLKKGDLNQREVGLIFNIAPNTVNAIKHRKTWKHV